jgi:hypothetical protein
VEGLCTSFEKWLCCNVKDLEGMFAVDSSSNIVNKVIRWNASSVCSLLVHNTKFFENLSPHACCKLWNASPIEICNHVEIKVDVSKKLNVWNINERDSIHTT